MTNRLKFTKRALESLKPGGKISYVYDTETRGLRIAVHPSGRKTFSLYRKFNQKPITIPLGEFPHVSVEQARKDASQKIAMIARGDDPREVRADVLTLGQFFEQQFLPEHFQGKPRSVHHATLTFDRYLHRWRKRPLASVTRADVERLHSEIAVPIKGKKGRTARGPVAANRVLTLLSSIYSKARDWGVFNGDNPVHGVRRKPEFSRTRVLGRTGELQKFIAALATEKDADLRLYLKVRLFNGVRERNIFEMRWDDVNPAERTWRIGETKNGHPLLVRLSTQVVDELLARERRSEFVFPGHKKRTHLTTVARDWRRFRKSLDLAENVELRDLRRTFASYALWAGVPISVIAQTMGHQPNSRITASVYALADDQLQSDAVRRTEQKMLAGANA